MGRKARHALPGMPFMERIILAMSICGERVSSRVLSSFIRFFKGTQGKNERASWDVRATNGGPLGRPARTGGGGALHAPDRRRHSSASTSARPNPPPSFFPSFPSFTPKNSSSATSVSASPRDSSHARAAVRHSAPHLPGPGCGRTSSDEPDSTRSKLASHSPCSLSGSHAASTTSWISDSRSCGAAQGGGEGNNSEETLCPASRRRAFLPFVSRSSLADRARFLASSLQIAHLM